MVASSASTILTNPTSLAFNIILETLILEVDRFFKISNKVSCFAPCLDPYTQWNFQPILRNNTAQSSGQYTFYYEWDPRAKLPIGVSVNGNLSLDDIIALYPSWGHGSD